MKLYHGTLADFNNIQLINSDGTKDFGFGFYTTDSLEHAKGRAENLYEKRHSAFGIKKYVYSYNIAKTDLRKSLLVKEFNKATVEWLDIISAFRLGLNPIEADVIIGPTADARAVQILNEYCFRHIDIDTGKLLMENSTKKYIMNRLRLNEYGTQYCFKTNKAVLWLNQHFSERREIL